MVVVTFLMAIIFSTYTMYLAILPRFLNWFTRYPNRAARMSMQAAAIQIHEHVPNHVESLTCDKSIEWTR